MIRLSLQPAPASRQSSLNNILASAAAAPAFCLSVSALKPFAFPPLSPTTYFFTEISLAAMIASVAACDGIESQNSSSFQIN